MITVSHLSLKVQQVISKASSKCGKGSVIQLPQQIKGLRGTHPPQQSWVMFSGFLRHCVAQTVLKCIVFPPKPVQCWNYRHKRHAHLSWATFLMESIALSSVPPVLC